MNRFCWSDGSLTDTETFVISQDGVALYDGDNKTQFEEGSLHLTTHRLIWKDARDPASRLSLSLSLVINVKHIKGGWNSSDKLILKLAPSTADMRGQGPFGSSSFDFIKLSFRRAGHVEFQRALNETIKAQYWNVSSIHARPGSAGNRSGPRAAGIVGIERKIAAKHKSTDSAINQAFEDLDQLMSKAKEMVSLSQAISAKLRERNSDFNDDDTAQFKAHLLSMGISDPVTKQSAGNKFATELARQLATFLVEPLKEHGGVMTLADAYCRVNRARGLELISPNDLVDAVRLMAGLHLPVRLKVFESGVMVLQLASQNEEEDMKKTLDLVTSRGFLTAEDCSRAMGIAPVLARERLLLTENKGLTCRDDTVEGLRFYPNMFLTSSGE